jgi:hypothetical protein
MERYPGSKGRTHGDRKEMTPPPKAMRICRAKVASAIRVADSVGNTCFDHHPTPVI